jgi:hypothetical protein
VETLKYNLPLIHTHPKKKKRKQSKKMKTIILTTK